MADSIFVGDTNYRPSLELKHIMAMYDAYYGDLPDQHYQELSAGKYNESPEMDNSRWSSLPTLTRDDSTIWIIENDALFVPQHKAKLSAIISSMPSDIPWLVWTGTCQDYHTTERPTDSIIIPADLDAGIASEILVSPCQNCQSRCTHSYMANRLGVTAILKEMERIAPTAGNNNIDHYLDVIVKNLRPAGELKSYWVEPALVYQNNIAKVSVGSLVTRSDGQ